MIHRKSWFLVRRFIFVRRVEVLFIPFDRSGSRGNKKVSRWNSILFAFVRMKSSRVQSRRMRSVTSPEESVEGRQGNRQQRDREKITEDKKKTKEFLSFLVHRLFRTEWRDDRRRGIHRRRTIPGNTYPKTLTTTGQCRCLKTFATRKELTEMNRRTSTFGSLSFTQDVNRSRTQTTHQWRGTRHR